MAQPGELFVMARVPEAIREALLRVLADAGMDTTLGRALYPPRNWHQSLSDLHPPEAREHLRLAGVEAIVAEGFERIHRTNLIGMGVLPLEFRNGDTRATYGIDGSETFDVVGERTPRATLTLVIHRANGESVEVPVTCRLDSDEEVSIYEAGGVLQRFAQDFLAQNKAA